MKPVRKSSLILLAALSVFARPCRGVPTVITRETFQGVGTLNAASPGAFTSFASGSIQKRAVGPRTATIAAPGWSGDMQAVSTDAVWNLTAPANATAQASGQIGCWVRFVEFAGYNGYYNDPSSFDCAMSLWLTRPGDNAIIAAIGVISDGRVVAQEVANGKGKPSTSSLAPGVWYWFQIAWASDPNGLNVQISYQPLGGSATLLSTSLGAYPGYVPNAAHVGCQSSSSSQAGYYWRGRLGNATLCSVGALTDAGVPIDDLAPPTGATTWYVNAAIGSDGNDGLTPATAWQTVTKLNTEMANAGVFSAASYAAGDTVTIDTTTANLPLGTSGLMVTTPGVNVVQLGGGLSGTGELQAWACVPNASFTPAPSTAKTYQHTLTESNPTCVLWEDDQWLNKVSASAYSNPATVNGVGYIDVRAALEANRGSFWTDGTTMYVHPFGDTNPSADGKVYTRSYLRPGGDGGAAAVQILAPNVHLSGLRVRKTCLADPLTNDPGAAYCYQTQGQLDGTMLVENCYGAYGSKHVFGFTDNSLTRQYTAMDCQAEQGSPYTGAGGQTVWVDYANNAGSNGTATSTYVRCTTLANTGLIGSASGQYRRDIPAWISHNSGQGALQFASCDFIDCNLAGGLNTGVTAVLRFTRGSCRGGSFGPSTVASFTGVNVPGGQPFSGAGQVTARNCLIVVDEIDDGFEPVVSGTVDYEGNTFDLSATVTNNDNHVLFQRTGPLNFTWRNNLLIGSTAFHYGVLRQAQNTDQVAFDHNAYQNVGTVAYGYNDGTNTADRTLAQWQALGEDTASFILANPMVDGRYIPALLSPLTDAGADLGNTQDDTGRTFLHRRTIGALEPLSTCARWQAENFTAAEINLPLVSGPNADPDGDGLSNLLEYALHTNPKSPNAAPVTTLGVQTLAGQSYLTLSYTQLTDSADLLYVPQASGDLLTWQSGSGQTVLLGSVDNGDGTATVVVRDAQPLGAGSQRFLRLQVSLPGSE